MIDVIKPAILLQIIGGSYSVITLTFLTSLVSVLFFFNKNVSEIGI